MIDRNHDLPVSHQARLLGISRGAVYYQARGANADNLKLMRRIDELHLDYPFAGARMLRDMVRREGFVVGRRHMRTLMQRMGIEATYRKPDTSKKHPARKVCPYLLRDLKIDRANQVWAMDITYIPMAKGWVYLTVVLAWRSRKVLAWRLSISMDVDFCIEAVEASDRPLGMPGNVQYRSRQPIHQPELHANAQEPRHCHFHGRQGLLARQRVRGAPVALSEIRGGLPQGLRERHACPPEPGQVTGLLQSSPATFDACGPNTRNGVS